MSREPDFGPRLSGEEYDRRIIALYSGLPPAPSKEQEREVRRKEFGLTVDHRLGRDFPADRRDALWAIHRRVGRMPLRLLFKSVFKRIFAAGLGRDAQKLAGHVVSEYGKVLTPPELEMFFGEHEVRDPGLPVDVDELRLPR